MTEAGESKVSRKINTAFIERQNGTDRTHNARKARKTLCVSKDFVMPLAVSWWVMVCDNFHFVNSGLRLVLEPLQVLHRTPAMAMGLARKMSVEQLVFTPVSDLPLVSELRP